jgi:hypothetical protein
MHFSNNADAKLFDVPVCRAIGYEHWLTTSEGSPGWGEFIEM